MPSKCQEAGLCAIQKASYLMELVDRIHCPCLSGLSCLLALLSERESHWAAGRRAFWSGGTSSAPMVTVVLLASLCLIIHLVASRTHSNLTLMSSFSAIRLPHLDQFGGMPHAANYSSPAQERMALLPLNVLPSRVYAPSEYAQMQKPMVVASPAATLSHQPAQSPSKKRVRALPNASKSITLDMLRPHFEKPLAEVANIFGICMTLMKKICRKNGVPRWPHRQIRGLRKSIWSIEKALRCCESEAQRRSYNDHLQKQRAKLLTILKGPASPSSKAAFELVLSEPCSPMGEVATPTASEKAQSPTVRFQMPTVYSQVPSNMVQGNLSPKLPSIASLLMKNDEQRSNFNYQF